jgi:hypothetical protein
VNRVRNGDKVKLSFLVRDAVSPEVREELGDMVDRVELESMRTEVTSVMGNYPACVYRGELLDSPLFIDPKVLRIGSPVNFTTDHVCKVASKSKRRTRHPLR